LDLEGLGLQLGPDWEEVTLTSSVTDRGIGVPGAGRGEDPNWVSLVAQVNGRPMTLTVYAEGVAGSGLAWSASSTAPVQLVIRPHSGFWPRRFQPGARFNLRFLLTASPRPMTAEALTRRMEDWRQRASAEP